MKVPGYGEIRTIHGWEDYLSWLDDHISLQENRIVCKFGNEYVIPLSDCATPIKALKQAFNLAANLAANEPSAQPDYVAKRFIQLIRKPLHLPHDLAEMFDELSQAFDISPKQRQVSETTPQASGASNPTS